MSTTKMEREIVDLEKQYWQAVKDGDVDAAMKLTDFPCLVASSRGARSVDREGFAQMMSDSSYAIRKLDFGKQPQVRMLSDDVAVIAYEIHEELTVDGKPKTMDAVDTSTWIRRNGEWRCALHSEAIKP
jgi:ketosteroid isomerase-like protein